MRKSGRSGRTDARAAPSRGSPAAPARPAAPPPDSVALGEFGRAHGLRGEVRLKSFTGDPMAIAGYDPLFDESGKRLRIASLRPAPGPASDMLIARIEGVADRDGAEAMNQRRVFTTRAALAASGREDEDEYLLADLIGMRVETRSGDEIGRIVAVPDYGAGDLLEIEPLAGGASALLPFTKTFVPTVDLGARRVVVDAPVDLFAPAAPEPEEPEPDLPDDADA